LLHVGVQKIGGSAAPELNHVHHKLQNHHHNSEKDKKKARERLMIQPRFELGTFSVLLGVAALLD
jgi:hypothetical protein